MLTVIRALAEAAEAAPALEPAELLALLVERGEEAVARTQEQLDVLREAGVVDAGGAGLVELVRGLAAAAAGRGAVARIAPPPRLSLEAVHQELSRYRYCTTFVVEGEGLDAAALEPELDRLGDSLLVVGDPSALKVHVHTDDPGAALSLGTRAGTIEGVEIADMHRQTEEREERLLAALPGGASRSAVVAVVAGEGNRRLFEDLGAERIVEGGQTMNPSTADLLDAIDATRRGRGRAAAEQRERRDGRRAGGARRRQARAGRARPSRSPPASRRSSRSSASARPRRTRRRCARRWPGSSPARSRSPRATPRPTACRCARASSSGCWTATAVAAGAVLRRGRARR